MKRYPVTFTVDSIEYTVQLSNIQLQEATTILTDGYDPTQPNSLFFRDKIRKLGVFLNESKISQPIPDLEGDSDFNDRLSLYASLQQALINSADDISPDWQDKLSDEQKKFIDEQKKLIASIKV